MGVEIAGDVTYNESVGGADAVEAVIEGVELLVDAAIQQIVHVQMHVLYKQTQGRSDVTLPPLRQVTLPGRN